MTDRELMQQALDALDKLLDKLNADICDNSGIWDEYCDGGNAMQALRARLAQPEQEAVAWISHNAGLYHGKPDESLNPLPLYTAPPQREWQGLTDKEYETMAEKYVTNYFFDTLKYAKAIEAKLKEKNND